MTLDIKKSRQFLKDNGYDKNVTIIRQDVEALLAKYEVKIIGDKSYNLKQNEQLFCDACGKEKEEGLDHCKCYEGKEWVKKSK